MKYVAMIFALVLVSSISINESFAQEIRKASYTEMAQVIIDKKLTNSVITSITLQSTSNQEFQIPNTVIDKIQQNQRILSVTLTNVEGCGVLGVQDNACILVNISREGLEGGIRETQDLAREIGDSVIDDLNRAFGTNAEFHSVYIHTGNEVNTALGTSGDVSGRGTTSAIYLIPYQSTDFMYSDISSRIIAKQIRESGGFFEQSKQLAKNDSSTMTLSIIPEKAYMLFMIKIIVPSAGIAEQITEINPLEFLGTDNLQRSKYFSQAFYPLNSLIHVSVLSDDYKVDKIQGKVVESLETEDDLRKNGWYFISQSESIDARYLFGKKDVVKEDDLRFTIYSGDIKPSEIIKDESQEGGGCLIATATFDSELAPQVQQLRELRDKSLMSTVSGASFMTSFNSAYYSFSPIIADYERENPIFKDVVKIAITPLLTSLTLLNYVEVNSESTVLGYGLGIIMINVSMYIIAPTIVIWQIKKKVIRN